MASATSPALTRRRGKTSTRAAVAPDRRRLYRWVPGQRLKTLHSHHVGRRQGGFYNQLRMIFDASLGNFGANADPRAMVATARAADELGFRALWTADHLLPPGSMSQFARVFEPLTCLSFVASITERVRLGTSVIVLPMRNPFVLAKQAATLDVLSHGRVILGIGVGWSAEEFANVHAEFRTRGARTEEAIRLFRHLWSGTRKPFEGRFYGFKDGVFEPTPVQGKDLPLLIGGRSDVVLRRVARHAAMWQTTSAAPDVFPLLVEKIRRQPGGERVEVGAVYPFKGSLDEARAAVREWEAAGAQHLSINFGPPDGRVERMRTFARAFGLASQAS
jgi:probable F420-dependent oxidoreductase